VSGVDGHDVFMSSRITWGRIHVRSGCSSSITQMKVDRCLLRNHLVDRGSSCRRRTVSSRRTRAALLTGLISQCTVDINSESKEKRRSDALKLAGTASSFLRSRRRHHANASCQRCLFHNNTSTILLRRNFQIGEYLIVPVHRRMGRRTTPA
jgi:hypothetical protein